MTVRKNIRKNHMPRVLRTPSLSVSVNELLASALWYQQIAPATKRRLLTDFVEKAVPAGSTLGHHGEKQRHWYGVLEGLLKWSINSSDGRTVTLGGQSVGSWFGEGTLLRGENRKADLIALRPSRVAMLPFETFEWLRHSEPSFNEFLLRQINERLHWFMGNFAAHRLLDNDRLVARALVGLVHPLQNPQGERHLVISQEELANLSAISRQRCNQALVAMKGNGLLQIDYGAIRILDLEALKALAE
jgi:CRP/FNR family transcriptional regulator, cyclic AMP receptor protein